MKKLIQKEKQAKEHVSLICTWREKSPSILSLFTATYQLAGPMFLLEKPPVQQVLTIQMKWARLLLSAVNDVLITVFMPYIF